MSHIFKNISTLGPIGYLSAPGTWASLATLMIVYILYLRNVSYSFYALFVLASAILAWYAVVHTLDFFYTWGPRRQMGQNHDPSEIVVDEAVGCMITFFMIPITFKSLVLGFIFFRVLDITKPFGLKKLERMGGAWGILLDDIGAGLLSNLMLHVLLYISFI